MKMKLTFWAVLIFALFMTGIATSDIPELMNYQGRLANPDGELLTGTFTIAFAIYDVDVGGTPLWTEIQQVDVKSGIFSVILGSLSPLSISFDGDRWFGIAVNADPEMVPRKQIVSTAYAFLAGNADDVRGKNINPGSVYIEGFGLVINSDGQWVGDPTGLRGPPGPAGPQGPKGDKGDTGDAGPQGIQGPIGSEGPAGSQGEQGIQGPEGPMGPEGSKGDTGDTGPIGPEGPAGPQGEQGIQGPKGDKGDPGDTGPIGPEGPQGEQGIQGLVGPQGLKGDTGDTGPTGSEGPAGPQGEQGIQGSEGPMGPQGLKGDKGDTGDIGPQGLQGEQGIQGPVGPEGPMGPQGLKGDTGDTGDIGPMGPEGPAGPEGPMGPQGLQGEKGDTGSVGPPGIQGPPGPEGPMGPEGPPGPAIHAIGKHTYGNTAPMTLRCNTGFRPGKITINASFNTTINNPNGAIISMGTATSVSDQKCVTLSGSGGGSGTVTIFNAGYIATIAYGWGISQIDDNGFTLTKGLFSSTLSGNLVWQAEP